MKIWYNITQKILPNFTQDAIMIFEHKHPISLFLDFTKQQRKFKIKYGLSDELHFPDILIKWKIIVVTLPKILKISIPDFI